MFINSKTYVLTTEKTNGSFFVDDPIAGTIQILNQKGYRTSACCSGHNERPIDFAYIQFGFGELTPETIPEGWYWCEDGQQMEYEYQSVVGEDRLKEIEMVMDALFAWAQTLPDAND